MSRKTIIEKQVLKNLPIQFLFIEEKKRINKKIKAVKLHKFNPNRNEMLIVQKFYKHISKPFDE